MPGYSNLGQQDLPQTPELSADSIAAITRSRYSTTLPGKDVINTIEVEGQVTSNPEFLGSGGSKEVFDIEVGGKHYAVAICGLQDTPERVMQKWSMVLKEPANTALLRARGFYVNELCETQSIKVNGVEFPALVMKRFVDHPFEIYDSKNTGKNASQLFDEETELSDDKMLTFMSSISDEIIRLIRDGIRLGRDSFNLCVDEGQMHLYFNDLGTMSIEPFLDDEKESVASHYVMYAIVAVISSVNEKTYQNNHYVNQMGNLNSTLQIRLQKQIAKLLGIPAP